MLCTSSILSWKSFGLWFSTKNSRHFRWNNRRQRVSSGCGKSSRKDSQVTQIPPSGSMTPKPSKNQPKIDEQDIANINKDTPPAPIRITLASVEEYNYLLQNGLDFYGATYFPTEPNLPATASKIATKKGR
jgi:hypothetical protein